jgi:hypothetical protein
LPFWITPEGRGRGAGCEPVCAIALPASNRDKTTLIRRIGASLAWASTDPESRIYRQAVVKNSAKARLL